MQVLCIQVGTLNVRMKRQKESRIPMQFESLMDQMRCTIKDTPQRMQTTPDSSARSMRRMLHAVCCVEPCGSVLSQKGTRDEHFLDRSERYV